VYSLEIVKKSSFLKPLEYYFSGKVKNKVPSARKPAERKLDYDSSD